MTIEQQIIQASRYAHVRAKEELSAIGMKDRADEVLKHLNELSVKLSKTK